MPEDPAIPVQQNGPIFLLFHVVGASNKTSVSHFLDFFIFLKKWKCRQKMNEMMWVPPSIVHVDKALFQKSVTHALVSHGLKGIGAKHKICLITRIQISYYNSCSLFTAKFRVFAFNLQTISIQYIYRKQYRKIDKSNSSDIVVL